MELCADWVSLSMHLLFLQKYALMYDDIQLIFVCEADLYVLMLYVSQLVSTQVLKLTSNVLTLTY